VLSGFLLFERPFEWAIDPALPLPEVPVDNPMSDVKVELGQLLYDIRVSQNILQYAGSIKKIRISRGLLWALSIFGYL